MSLINYLYDVNGSKTALLLNLKPEIQPTFEQLEDIEDVIEYELSKFMESYDYDQEIQKILNN